MSKDVDDDWRLDEMSTKLTKVKTRNVGAVNEAALLADLRHLIQSARQSVATVANATHAVVCWYVGRRLLKDNLQDGRAAYGKQILVTVSQELTHEFGRGFTYAGNARMIQFAQVFSNEAIVSTLSTQLSWSHFMELLPIKDPLARDFYAEMCRIERWDVRTFRKKIGGMLFQRTHRLDSYLSLLMFQMKPQKSVNKTG